MSSYCVFHCCLTALVILACNLVISLNKCWKLDGATSSCSLLLSLTLERKRHCSGLNMHMNLLILSCLFIGIKTLCTLVCFKQSNVKAVLTPAVVPLARICQIPDRLLHSLSETLLSVTMIQLCSFYVVKWSSEVTNPLSMKEVGGYIEKQVAYLSGESSANY